MRWTRAIAFTATAIACSFVELKEPADGFTQKKRKGNRRAGGLPFVDGSGRRSQALFAKDEDALLARETHFFHLAIFSDQYGIIVGLGITLFPTAFTLGDDGLAFLHRRFVAVDQQAIFAGLEIGLADPGGLGDVDGFADGLGKNREGESGHGQERRDPKERVGFHACQLPFHVRVSRTTTAEAGQNG